MLFDEIVPFDGGQWKSCIFEQMQLSHDGSVLYLDREARRLLPRNIAASERRSLLLKAAAGSTRPRYSWRRATIGSTRMARRAGR